VDPVADVAVLESPDGQVLYDEAEAYDQFVERRPTLRIGTICQRTQAWVLSLDGQWQQCIVDTDRDARSLTIFDRPTKPGMSGSPIVTDTGCAIGLVSVGGSGESTKEGAFGQPLLVGCLPGWVLAQAFPSVTFLESIKAIKTSWETRLKTDWETHRSSDETTLEKEKSSTQISVTKEGGVTT
jgi:hypothetical protein